MRRDRQSNQITPGPGAGARPGRTAGAGPGSSAGSTSRSRSTPRRCADLAAHEARGRSRLLRFASAPLVAWALAVLLAVIVPAAGLSAQADGGAGDNASPGAGVLGASAAEADGERPVLTYVEGDVRAVRSHRNLVPDNLSGAPLEPFDFVATAADGRARIRLGTGQESLQLTLAPDSALMIRAAGEGGRTAVELLHGIVSADLGVQAPLELRFREGRLEAVDARFALSLGALGGFRVDVAGGRVAVRLEDTQPERLFASPERSVVYHAGSGVFENVFGVSAGEAGEAGDTAAGDPGSTAGTDGNTGDEGAPGAGSILPSQWRNARRAAAIASGAAWVLEREDPGQQPRDSRRPSVNPLVRRREAYLSAEEAFNEAYRAVNRSEPAVLEWMRADDIHRSVSEETIEGLEEPMARLEAARRAFEALFWQWASLAPVVPADLRPQSVSRDRRIMVERLHTTRHLMRLFSEAGRSLPALSSRPRQE